ncbi:MAG: MarR family transcriptional regulator [Gammaproteobacteria bacterium]|nr:MarR family transcriptional regulator [Gammaproteobacteria bacterium]
MRAQQALLERVEADLKAADLPPLAWYDVLLELGRTDEGQLRQFELGDKVLLSKYNVSRLLDRLELEGLVKRHSCKEDRRGAHVAITKDGRALQKKMWPVYEHAISEYFARHLSAAEIEQLAKLMGRLLVTPA